MSRAFEVSDEVAILRRPDAWPDHPDHVDVKETHLSWVFLTATRAYKIKKPVVFDVADFRSLAARRTNAEREVALNRRLASAIYLGIEPLVVENDALVVGGTGRIVDWIVVMRRLADEALLAGALARGPVEPGRVQKVAHVLASFFAAAPPIGLAPHAYRDRIVRRLEESERAIVAVPCGLPTLRIRALFDALRDDVSSGLLDRRAGRVIDGHGDLRPEHVCLEPPVVIDCLEFDASLRLRDPVDEIAQLMLGCARSGAPAIGRQFLDAYREVSGDEPEQRLIGFYEANAATVDARLAAWRLAGSTAQPERLIARVRASFVAAEEAARIAARPAP